MTMDAETAEALEESIEHWDENARRTVFDANCIFSEAYALCNRFCDREDYKDCDGCPVSLRTGQPECRGSPWYDVRKALSEWERAIDLANEAAITAAAEAFRAKARVQLEFLKSLRDPELTP